MTIVEPKELSCEGNGVDVGGAKWKELEPAGISERYSERETVEAEIRETNAVLLSVVVAGTG